MLWLEMSRHLTHGGGSWGFGQSLWSPAFKQSGGMEVKQKWRFWENLLRVRAGDSVLHLRGTAKRAAFVGFSVAQTDGIVTEDRPPSAGQYAYASRFYRVLLKTFVPFPEPLHLAQVLSEQKTALMHYFQQNKDRPRGEKRGLFYVVQAARLQCLNGALPVRS